MIREIKKEEIAELIQKVDELGRLFDKSSGSKWRRKRVM